MEALFWPRSVAVVGASAREHAIGHSIIANLQAFGYRGPIYPVHPSATQILGLPAYPGLPEVPGEVDLVHLVVPAAQVPGLMAQCGARGVRAVIINSAGFGELGEQGLRLQQAFMDEARLSGIRVLGPNCQGIINTDPSLRAYCNFTNTLPAAGGVSLVAQSGGVGGFILQGLADIGVGVRLYASNGNGCDVSITEILRFYGDDPGTRVVVLYTEGLAEPAGFLEVARAVTARKPVLAMRAGRTERGAQAASSHTGALAGAGRVTDLVFERAGIIAFDDEGELIRAAMAHATQPAPRGPRTAVLTNTGGPAVIATDALVSQGLQVPALAEATVQRLRAALLPQAALDNPVDVIATAGPGHFRAALQALLDDDAIDALLVAFVTPSFTDTQGIAHEIVAASAQQRKPLVCNFMTDPTQPRFQATRAILQDGGVPCFAYPGDAARALAALWRGPRLRQRPAPTPRRPPGIDAPRARAIVDSARAAGRLQLPAQDVLALLRCYGIPLAAAQVVDGAEAAAAAAREIGFPVVVKIDTEAASHKSDVGGVVLGLHDEAAVHAAVSGLQQRLAGLAAEAPLRFLVQAQLAGGQELIVGASRAPGIGHLLMFGLGGIHVEVLGDVVFELAPVGPGQAAAMLGAIRAAALLEGVRGRPALDRAAIADVIERVSCLVQDLPEIDELDLNPLLAWPEGARAVDARIRLAPAAAPA
ncbi:MAG: acetate--CoA ligase family protein [Rubrivivax sp.]|nr:acetate--CoA ligase family protein [Rubrivivax sp.]